MSRTPRLLGDLAREISLAPEGNSLTVRASDIGEAVLDLIDHVPVTRHPLGFYHLELTDLIVLPQQRVRLHIWTASSMKARDEQGLHHAHTWSLASCVLVGSLCDTSYRAIETKTGEFTAVEIHYPEDILRPTDVRYSLVPIRTRDVTQGYVYRLPDNVPHSTAITSVPTATLVVARESGREHTPIFRRDLPQGDVAAVRCLVSVEDAAKAVATALCGRA